MEKTNLTCIRCPLGCALTVTVEDCKASVAGNTCPRGAAYGAQEVTAPVRTVTASIRVRGGALPLVSVKTAAEIPKARIFDVMDAIHAAEVPAPVRLGDVLLRDAAGTGVDIVATRTVEKRP